MSNRPVEPILQPLPQCEDVDVELVNLRAANLTQAIAQGSITARAELGRLVAEFVLTRGSAA